MNSINPPSLVERFFRWFCHQAHLEGLEGDLYELFELRVAEVGHRRARFYYFTDMLTLLRPSVIKSFSKVSKTNNAIMGIINSYLKTTIRTGRKRAWFSTINLIGLTLGITSVLFILLFVRDELKYDTHINSIDSKYRVYNIREGEDGEVNYLPIVPPAFAPNIIESFPQVEKVGRVMYDYGGTVFKIEDKSYSEKNGVFAERGALEILDIQMLAGDLSRMDEPKAVLLSETTFKKFFGEVPFANQTITWGKGFMQVLGVYKNLPEQSHLDLDYIFPYAFAASNWSEERRTSWVWQQFYTYVQFAPGADYKDLEIEIQKMVSVKSKGQLGEYKFSYTPYLQPIRDIHLHSSNFEWDIAKRGSAQSIFFLGIAAAIILLIACLNFINLTTAQAIKRAKEVCVRKFVGAKRSQLILQYGMEATLYTLLSGIMSALIIIMLLPYFNVFADKNILLGSFLSPLSLGLYFLSLLFLGLVSGAYPAIVITSFNPLMAVQGGENLKIGKGGGVNISSRQLLVGTQYVLSIGLILLSLIIQKQFSFLQNNDMGFNKENLVVLPLTRKMRTDSQGVTENFSNNKNVVDVALSYGTPGGIVAGDGIYLPDRTDHEHSSNMFMADEKFLTTMGIQIIAGRDFNPEMATDASEAFIINETAVKNFGLGSPEEAIGEPINWNIWGAEDSLKKGMIIGVVADFNFKSLHNEMSSAVIHLGANYMQSIIVRIKNEDIPGALEHLEATYKKYEPTRPFEYTFIDETFKQFYAAEQKLNGLFSMFTIMAIITAGIGLFGMVSFNILNRGREISIRKVLGASINSVVQLLVIRYFVMGIICLLIATPIAYYFAEQWLQNFSYAIELNAWTFIEVALITLLFTAATVGFQAFRGASANPAQKLRSE